MLQTAVQWLLDTIGAMGYPGIFILMAMESSIIPVPSELVMPPAGYLAFQGRMNLAAVILCGTAGSMAGAYVNYAVSHYLGRPLILRYGRYVLIPPAKFERIERFFLKHGEISTFIGRLLPVVRHLVSIPAGLAGMSHLRFSLYTMAGAAIWCGILAGIGYVIGGNRQLIIQYSHQALLWVIPACMGVVAVYVWRQRKR
jgi:membrane protein DedA with SNARE-associated domain